MARLLHLNGPPGIGKSTLARRYAAEHPGVLCCDVDVLRTFIGGWREDFLLAGHLVRPAALAMVGAYLAASGDVVLPQMLADPAEVDRFAGAAEGAGATYLQVMLLDDEAASVARFHRRGAHDPDPWHEHVRGIVADQGGDALLSRTHAALLDMAERRPGVEVVPSAEGDVDATYAALVAAVDRDGPGPGKADGP